MHITGCQLRSGRPGMQACPQGRMGQHDNGAEMLWLVFLMHFDAVP